MPYGLAIYSLLYHAFLIYAVHVFVSKLTDRKSTVNGPLKLNAVNQYTQTVTDQMVQDVLPQQFKNAHFSME